MKHILSNMTGRRSRPAIIGALALAAVSIAAPLADAGEKIGLLRTLHGKLYRGCEVIKVDPDGLFVRHAAGAAKIAFTDLAPGVRTRFGYSPTRAASFVAARTGHHHGDRAHGHRVSARAQALARRAAIVRTPDDVLPTVREAGASRPAAVSAVPAWGRTCLTRDGRRVLVCVPRSGVTSTHAGLHRFLHGGRFDPHSRFHHHGRFVVGGRTTPIPRSFPAPVVQQIAPVVTPIAPVIGSPPR